MRETAVAALIIDCQSQGENYLKEEPFRQLGRFTNQAARIIPVLIDGLKHSSTWKECVSSLSRFGTNAYAPFRDAAKSEGNVFGPLNTALDMVQQPE